jgi:hypothetical protein
MCTLDFAAIHLAPSRLKPVPQGSAASPTERTRFRGQPTANPTGRTRSTSGTRFSREEACVCALDFAAIHLAPSRLKPVPQGSAASPTERTRFRGQPHSQSHRMYAIHQWDRLQPARGLHVHLRFCSDTTDAFPAKAGPTGIAQPARPNARTHARVSVVSPSRFHWIHAIHQWDRLQPGRGPHVHPGFCSDTPDAFPAKAGPTGFRSQPDRTHAFPW